MVQTLSKPQRFRGFVLTDVGLQKLHDRIQQLETQTRLRQNPRSIAERIQLSQFEGIHFITVKKILGGQHGVDKRSLQIVFQVLQLSLEEGDYAHAGLCQSSARISPEASPEGAPEGTSTPWHPDWSAMPDLFDFHGRVQESTPLKQAILTQPCRLVQILGTAGVGKTALAKRLSQDLQPEFEIVIWKSLRHAPTLSAVLTNVLQFLGQRMEKDVKLPTHSAYPVEALTGLLIEQLQEHRCLLVFDHFDSVLRNYSYAGYCRPGYETYHEFLQEIVEIPHQSCLIFTSREQPRAIGMTEERYVHSLQLNGLSVPDARSMLNGSHPLTGTADDWRSLIQQWDGHPLVLKRVAGYIRDYFDSRISEYLTYLEPGRVLCHDLRDFFKQQFNRLSPVEQAFVYDLALQKRPISVSQFHETIASSRVYRDWLEGLDSLGRRSLLRRQGIYFTLDPLMKRYVNDCLLEQRGNSPDKFI